MSLAVVVRGPDGIALATDSRRVFVFGEEYLSVDDSPKLVSFASQPHVAAAFTGFGGGIDTFRRALVEADARLPRERASVHEVARRLVEATVPTAPEQASLIVAGYDPDGTSHVFVSDIPKRPEPVEREGYSIVYSGQREFVDRLLQGWDARLSEALDRVEGLDGLYMKIPLDRITLQGSVELARFLVETTIGAQKFIEGICGVGGAVHVATVTTGGFSCAQRPAAAPKVGWYPIVEVAPAVTDVPADGIGAAWYTAAR